MNSPDSATTSRLYRGRCGYRPFSIPTTNRPWRSCAAFFFAVAVWPLSVQKRLFASAKRCCVYITLAFRSNVVKIRDCFTFAPWSFVSRAFLSKSWTSRGLSSVASLEWLVWSYSERSQDSNILPFCEKDTGNQNWQWIYVEVIWWS